MIYLESGHSIGDEAIFGVDNRAHFNAFDSVTTEADGYPGTDATNGLTYGGWRPTADPATISYDPVTGALDYLGIAAHNLGTCGATIELEIGGVSIGTITPTDDSPILFLFDTRLAATADVIISGYGTDYPTIGVIKIGRRLTMERRIYGGVNPISLCRVTTMRPRISEAGKILSRPIIRQGYRGTAEWRHLGANWVRDTFDYHSDLMVSEPFFFAWRPMTFGKELVYGQTTADIHPTNMGIRDLMSLSVDIEAVESGSGTGTPEVAGVVSGGELA